MRRFQFIISLILGFQLTGLAQTPESIRRDSLTVDSLQKRLTSLRDTARINCLNSVAEAFINNDGYKIKRRADSAYRYAMMANDEARKLNYKQGLAYSLVNFCSTAFFIVIDNNNHQVDNTAMFARWNEYLEKLLALAAELNDNDIWASAYYSQADFFGKKNNRKGGIEALKKSLEYFQKNGNEARVSEISTWLCMQYSGNGEYEKGFDYCKLSLQLAKKRAVQKDHGDLDDYMLQQALMNMSDLYSAAADYETALDYLRQTQQFYLSHKSSMTWSVESNIGELFAKMGRLDSALRYQKPINVNIGAPMNSWAALKLGETYLMKRDYDSAVIFFNKAIEGFRKNKNANSAGIKNSLTGAAKANAAKKNYKTAFPLVRESVSIAQNEGDLISLRDNYEILSELFYRSAKSDSAYLYLKKAAVLKDSILNRQFYFRLNSYKKEAEEEKKTSQINLLNKDKLLMQQKLNQQAFIRNALLGGLLLFLLLGVFVFRSFYLKRKNERLSIEKQQAELQQKVTELEMQALRAQMNPHFIFNCLSSINKFVLKNETQIASDYLTRFSRLIRLGLTNSQLSLIPLSDEIEMLRLYLEMERLRFSNAFDFNIVYANAIEPETIYIPPMLLQPFCENAIWHGLMHKEGPGKLEVIMQIRDNKLQCIITDNGIGRKKAAELKSRTGTKQKSLGLKITTERLALFNNEKLTRAFYQTEDIIDDNGNVGGTKVILNIKLKQESAQLEKETV